MTDKRKGRPSKCPLTDLDLSGRHIIRDLMCPGRKFMVTGTRCVVDRFGDTGVDILLTVVDEVS